MGVIKVESFDVSPTNDGDMHTLTNDVGNLSSAFVKINGASDKGSGRVGNTGNIGPRDTHMGARLTGTGEVTFHKGGTLQMRKMGEVWRYTGLPGGPDEFIVRGHLVVTLPAGTSSGSAPVPSLINKNDVVPFLTGLSSTSTSVSDFDAATVATHIDTNGDLVVSRRSTGIAITVYVSVVEFTGTNWTIGHAISANHDTAQEIVEINSDSTGTGGTAFSVGDWEHAFIEGSMQGDTSETGLSDNLIVMEPGGTPTQIRFFLHQDANARNDGVAYAHVLSNPAISVARESDTDFAETNGTVGTMGFPSGAPTNTPIDELSLEWFSDTSGVGTAHARGRVIARITDSSGTIEHWVHRTGNTVSVYWGVIDLSNVIGVARPVIDSTNDVVYDGGSNITVTGSNYQTVQGSGKLEIWGDLEGTLRVEQAVTTWTDVSISYNFVRGGLPDGVGYLVVTNADSVASALFIIDVGFPDYLTVVNRVNPDHMWVLDGNYDDTGSFPTSPMTSSVTGTQNFINDPLCENVVQTVQFTGINSKREAADNTEMNLGVHTARTMWGWIKVSDIQEQLSLIYKEGGTINNIMFARGYGNKIMAQLADTGDDNVQAYSDRSIIPERAYLIAFRYDYSDTTPAFEFWIDGILQSRSTGNPLTASSLDSHSGDILWNDSDSSLEVGGTDVTFRGNNDIKYNVWGSTTVKLTDEQMRFELFEYGALPDFSITSDTPANMQAQLDSIANTHRADSPLAIRVEKPVGTTDMTLIANNITFDPHCSIDVQWAGTGTLSWINLNGSNTEKTSEKFGGNMIIVNPATLTLTGLQNPTEVRIYDTGTTTEVAGQEDVTSGTFSTDILVEAVDVVIHSLGFQYKRLTNINTSGGDVNLPIQQRIDRQYLNA